MGFRDALADLIRPTPTADATVVTPISLADQMRAGIAADGMDSRRMLGPSQPINPVYGYSRTPRSHDYSTGYNIAARPRSHERVSFSTLKSLIDSYDVAQVCIQHRIDDVRSMDYSFKPDPDYTGDMDTGAAVAIARAKMRRPDGVLPFRSWLAKFLDDVLRYDAGTLFRMRNRRGDVVGLKVIDGTTIAPLIDYYGDRPATPAPAFVQYAQGIPWDWLSTDDLIYTPFRPQPSSPYGKAPIETVLLTANTDLRFQAYFLRRFTEGTVPEGFAQAPKDWTPDQIADFQSAWDDLLYGDEAAKHQVKWVPNGTTFQWPKDTAFDSALSAYLERKTCAAYGVQPNDIGITDDVNRSTGEVQQDIQARVGNQPLSNYVEDIVDAYLQDDLGLPVILEFDTNVEKEDRFAEAQADQIYWALGAIGTDEIRTERLGLDVDPEMAMPRGIYAAKTGFIPLREILAVGGDLNPLTDAPEDDEDLPEAAYTGTPGVLASKPADLPAIAAIDFPAANPVAPIAKELTAGVTAETGIVGDPLAAGKPDPDDEDELEDQVAKERETFARFAKKRRKDGRWSDFTFAHVDQITAHRLNDRGRAQIAKATGEIVAAGLAVVAADTGRVLMLQRGLSDDDPAGGDWECPGGHVESGEDPQQAAAREWCEETGCLLPLGGSVTGGWTSANGIYQGFVYTIASESELPIFGDRACVSNPDDPDGDLIEAIAWWDPSDLPGNSAVRAELGADIELVLAAIAPVEVVKASADSDPKARRGNPRWHDAPIRRLDVKSAEFHAVRVQAALAGLLSPDKIAALVAGYNRRRDG